MKVNTDKTAMLAISDATSYDPTIYIETGDGERLESSDKPLRILGFMFDSRPTASAQKESLI